MTDPDDLARAYILLMRGTAKSNWSAQWIRTRDSLTEFASGLGQALGDISHDEAVDALKRETAVQIERMR